MANNILTFSVSLSAEDVLAMYRGDIRRVMVITDNGLRVDINAQHFMNFTTRQGIHGRFRIVLDSNNKLVRMEKIG